MYKNNYKNDEFIFISKNYRGNRSESEVWSTKRKSNIKIQQVFCSMRAAYSLCSKTIESKSFEENAGMIWSWSHSFPPSNFFVVSRQGWSNSRGRECLRFKMYAPSRPEIAVGLQKNGSARSTGRSIKRNWWRITRPARSSVFTIHS